MAWCSMGKLLCIENMATWRAVNCRFQGQITRPAIANERLSVNRAGQVVLKLKTPYRDGTSHIVMSLLEFMQRLPEPMGWLSLRSLK